MADARHLASHSYEWIVEGDIKACFDEISHSALMDQVRLRVGDKRVLALVKAFLKAGILGEDRALRDIDAGTAQGSILSPLLSNVALAILYVYTYPAKKALAAITAKVKMTWRMSVNRPLAALLHQLGSILRGWTTYFRPGVSSAAFAYLRAVVWRLVFRWLRRKHPKSNWRNCAAATALVVGGHTTMRWNCSIQRKCAQRATDTGERRSPHRGPAPHENTRLTRLVESPLPGDGHGGFGERPGETDQEQSRHRAPGRLNAEHWVHLRTNPIESTFSIVRHRTKFTKGPGSRAAGLAMAFKLIESAQAHWRAVNAPHLVALVRAGATFVNGQLAERRDEQAPPTAA